MTIIPLCAFTRVWCVCCGTSEPPGQPAKCVSGTSEEEEDDNVKGVRGDKSFHTLPLLDQLLPVYCCTELSSQEDKTALAFDCSGTEAHPATDAILFGASSHLIT